MLICNHAPQPVTVAASEHGRRLEFGVDRLEKLPWQPSDDELIARRWRAFLGRTRRARGRPKRFHPPTWAYTWFR